MNGNLDEFLGVLKDHSDALQTINANIVNLTARVEKILDSTEQRNLFCECFQECVQKNGQ